MNSEERPYSMHDPEERNCEFCTDIFYAVHGLQRYCPEKYGKKDYCKYQQKKLLNEKRLADLAIKLAHAYVPIQHEKDPLYKNIAILREELGPYGQRKLTNDFLDEKGYNLNYYTAKIKKGENNDVALVVGPYLLEWIDNVGELAKFKITRS